MSFCRQFLSPGARLVRASTYWRIGQPASHRPFSGADNGAAHDSLGLVVVQLGAQDDVSMVSLKPSPSLRIVDADSCWIFVIRRPPLAVLLSSLHLSRHLYWLADCPAHCLDNLRLKKRITRTQQLRNISRMSARSPPPGWRVSETNKKVMRRRDKKRQKESKIKKRRQIRENFSPTGQ